MDGRGGDNSFFITSRFGQIKIFDIPWGNYQLDEVSASSNGFVLKHTNFTITYNGELKSKDIVNYVIRDEIIIHKVDSGTGKRIPSDRTALRVRYMGNPNTPENQRPGDPNYGKYLTHQIGPSGALSYIFYTDANGKLQFPYPLQYGVYQLEEIVAPAGYYLGRYGSSGLGGNSEDTEGYLDTVTRDCRAVRLLFRRVRKPPVCNSQIYNRQNGRQPF
jgi:hypothetical protein